MYGGCGMGSEQIRLNRITLWLYLIFLIRVHFWLIILRNGRRLSDNLILGWKHLLQDQPLLNSIMVLEMNTSTMDRAGNIILSKEARLGCPHRSGNDLGLEA